MPTRHPVSVHRVRPSAAGSSRRRSVPSAAASGKNRSGAVAVRIGRHFYRSPAVGMPWRLGVSQRVADPSRRDECVQSYRQNRRSARKLPFERTPAGVRQAGREQRSRRYCRPGKVSFYWCRNFLRASRSACGACRLRPPTDAAMPAPSFQCRPYCQPPNRDAAWDRQSRGPMANSRRASKPGRQGRCG